MKHSPVRKGKQPALVVGFFVLVFTVAMFVPSIPPLVHAAPGPSVDLDQCRNGTLASPTDPCDWTNGNLGSSNSHYTEGQSGTYRVTFDNLTVGTSYTLEIGFDITSGGKHAIDFLTYFDRIDETVDPCDGISPCVAGAGFDIPAPPATTPNTLTYFNALEVSEGNQQFAIYNGVITAASYTLSGDETSTGSSEARVSITFTAGAAEAVLAWGGHIASAVDWGIGNSAGGISGSPYHMRLIDFSGGNPGNQDRSMSAAAVTPSSATLTVIKAVVNDNGGTGVAGDFSIHVKTGGVDVSGSPAAGSSTGTTYTLAAGTYAVSEDSVTGYTMTGITGDCATDGSITLVAGDAKTCTIINDDNAVTTATLNVIKVVVNDNGGAKIASGFTINVTGTNALPASFAGADAPGTTVTLDAGAYSVDEVADSGYDKTLSTDCSGTIAAGETKTCTITNDDKPATLTVIKHVENGTSGTKTAADFTMTVTGTDVSPSSFPGEEAPGTTVTLDAGSYDVEETALTDYDPTFSADCSGTIANGDTKTCTVTNTYNPPPGPTDVTLTLVKTVVNDNGGTKAVADFELFINGNAATSGTAYTLAPGLYTASETAVSGYTASVWGGNCAADGTIMLFPGDVKTCTITNDDNASTTATLIIIKTVINNNSGTNVAGDFTINVTATSPSSASFSGMESPGTTIIVSSGSYSIDEADSLGYNKSLSTDCSGTIAAGETKTCTITNDDPAPTTGGGGTGPGGGGGPSNPDLKIITTVINDNGGTASPQDFIHTIKNSQGTLVSGTPAGGLSSGITYSLPAGDYDVDEDSRFIQQVSEVLAVIVGTADYTFQGFTGDCSNTGSVTLSGVGTKVCTLTYNDTGAGSGTGSVTPTPTPTGQVAGASTTPTPTPTGEVLGATKTLPETGFSPIDRMVIAFFLAMLLTGIAMILVGAGVLPHHVLSTLQ